jgi:hypothetical protein
MTILDCEMLFWLAAREIVFFGTWEENLGDWTNGWTSAVNVNDTFYYACADAESLEPGRAHEVRAAYERWGYHGVIAWASIKRNQDPLARLVTPAYLEAKAELLKLQPPIERYPPPKHPARPSAAL